VAKVASSVPVCDRNGVVSGTGMAIVPPALSFGPLTAGKASRGRGEAGAGSGARVPWGAAGGAQPGGGRGETPSLPTTA